MLLPNLYYISTAGIDNVFSRTVILRQFSNTIYIGKMLLWSMENEKAGLLILSLMPPLKTT